jgi:hypothetical protein
MEGFMRSSRHFRVISQLLILAMLHLCWLTSYGYAKMIPTESAAQSQVQDDRQRLLDLLDRQEVIDELAKYGISKVEATARINSLTDEEVATLNDEIEQLPAAAGAEGIVDAIAAAAIIAYWILYYSPAIVAGAVYFAFTPIAAGVCIFLEGPWGDYMGDYWGAYVNGVRGIYGDNSDKASFEEDCDPALDFCDDEASSEEDCDPALDYCDNVVIIFNESSQSFSTDPIEHGDCEPGLESCD